MFRHMKRVGWTVGAAGVALSAFLAATTVADLAAQGPTGGPRQEGGPGRHGGPGMGPGGGGLGHLMRLRSLTDAQREQLRALAQSRREEGASLARQLGEARRALMASAESGAVDETKAADVGAATSALALMHARLQADALAILTPEQKAELAAQRSRLREWWESRPDGRSGRGRGRPAA